MKTFPWLFVISVLCASVALAQSSRPNVVIVIVDDQGYGELSVHGNPVVKTPHLDRLHHESVRFGDFHVAPMCTPTRGQLMTGLDALRNGAMNVSSGRTLLRRDLPTMANHFAAAGYRAGIFGKWHLGDAYPYRPEDRGFHEALWFPSSHIGSVPDEWNNAYFDDAYTRNGQRKKYAGYTTDVFFGEAIAWMKTQAESKQPFLCYIPTAAPHSPHYVPAAARQQAQRAFAQVRGKLAVLDDRRAEQLVRYLAMIENVDENFGRMESFLREAGLRDNTIVIFLTDNGSTSAPAIAIADGKLPAGVALPIAGARLKMAGFDQTIQVSATDRAATFNVALPAGRTTLQTWFLDAAGKPLLGAYYVETQRK